MDQVRLSTDENKVNVPKFERLELSFAYTRVHSYAAQEFLLFGRIFVGCNRGWVSVCLRLL